MSGRARIGEVDLSPAVWVVPWLVGMGVIGFLGRYGGHDVLPDWWDLAVVIVFSLAIYYWSVSLGMEPERVKAAVEREKRQIEAEQDLNLAG